MQKREKIILGLALAAIVYGLIDFFLLSKGNSLNETEQIIAQADKNAHDFAERSTAEISKIAIGKNQEEWQSLVTKIESDWKHDPFVLPVEPEHKSVLPVSDIIYSGYIHAGNISFAIINGVEYKPGELIEKYGYRVVEITSKKVILQKNDKHNIIFLEEN